MSDLTVTIFFDWQQASADPRQYNQQRILLAPRAVIAVNVPLKAMYIHNTEEILQAQISGGDKIKPVLTPLGMAYCDDQLVNAYRADASEGVPDDDIDWEDEEYKEPTNNKSLVDDLFEDDDELVIEKLKDDSEFPVEELIDGDDEDELDEILWEN